MRPPERWPNAATRCSRPPSRRCVGSACAPGGSARSLPPPSSCSTSSMATPHDQQVVRTATGNGSLDRQQSGPDREAGPVASTRDESREECRPVAPPCAEDDRKDDEEIRRQPRHPAEPVHEIVQALWCEQ